MENVKDHNFCHNLLMWQVVSGGVVDPPRGGVVDPLLLFHYSLVVASREWWVHNSTTHNLPCEQVVTKFMEKIVVQALLNLNL